MAGLKYKKARLIRKKTYRSSREFYHRLYTQKTLDDSWLKKKAKELNLKVKEVGLHGYN